jgi:predicted GNAT superfamily acetyltransferase
MTIDLRAVSATDDLIAVEQLQRSLLGEHSARSICGLPVLRSVVESGGLVIAAWDTDDPDPGPAGALVDLSGSHDGFSALFSLFVAVRASSRNRGIGFDLRVRERLLALERGVEVVRWWIDPLRGEEAHVALNKLGGVGVVYQRNVLGELSDHVNAGLATDRCVVEWWIGSPRSEAVIVEGRLPAHYRLGFDQMTVVTKTTLTPSGQRTLVDFDRAPTSPYVLAEIPVHLDSLREADPAEARRWRLATRELFENLFSSGYLLVGLVHEAGRSFQLLEDAPRGDVLGRG